jgi:hypothetical protein
LTRRLAQLVAGVPPALLLVVLACGCGSGARGAPSTGASPARPVFGLTEDDAALLWRPGAAQTPQAPAAVTAGREELTALHPRYLRLLIDWAALQPDPHRALALEAPVSGCARTVAPCVAYMGVREELAAIASQQHAALGDFEVVIDIYGTPAWAASVPAGCERGSLGAFSRAPSAAGISAYRSLIRALVALGQREGVALHWWAPWNEPNDPTFLSPQRSSCSVTASDVAPIAYAALVRAMAAQFRAEGGERHMLLGELNAYQAGSTDRTSAAEFVSALPQDVACLGDAWSIHAYADRDQFAPGRDPVALLEHALDSRGGCTGGARIWVTEAGAGAPHAGASRQAGGSEERASCLALARQLLLWSRDPQVGAVFQYTFRDDPAFPVGLADPALSRTYPAYRLWLDWLATHDAAAHAGRCA